ncbi:MAG: type II toxin-antitoxin system RelE/ParE family toxin [Candidatus Gracilibacteria bacterium]|nr:type II toxin-antitoxin system RelE/ParE family toxin [Candidatus Gracilibacteria bacterium]
MERYKKFLSKLPVDLREKLILVVCKIAENDLVGLDLKLLQSNYKIYRCRVGKVRILFQVAKFGNKVLDIGFRGDVYKGLS